MKLFLFVLIVAAALVELNAALIGKKCAANGEYCLTHSECCSGSCLSYSYKCVPLPPGPSTGTTWVTVDPDVTTSAPPTTCAKNGEYCLTASDCCSGSCLSFSYKCVPVHP